MISMSAYLVKILPYGIGATVTACGLVTFATMRCNENLNTLNTFLKSENRQFVNDLDTLRKTILHEREINKKLTAQLEDTKQTTKLIGVGATVISGTLGYAFASMR